jgi:hypothetical protein
VEPQTCSDVVGRFKQMLLEYQKGLMGNYLPLTSHTEEISQRLAALKPKSLAAMHGSNFIDDDEQAIKDLALVMKDVLS